MFGWAAATAAGPSRARALAVSRRRTIVESEHRIGGGGSVEGHLQPGEEDLVPTYIMLSTLTPEGIQTVKNNPVRIKEVNREVEQLGAEVKAQWATLGSFDFVNIIEAPDEKTMARISLELGSRGSGHHQKAIATPTRTFY